MKRTVIFLFLALIPAAAHALTVDYFQDCESGSGGDLLTPAIMNVSSHGTVASAWTAIGTHTWVSTNKVKQLPGTVTVGGRTYTDTGTRTWASDDKWEGNMVRVDLTAAAANVTLGCYLTPGPTVYVYNNFDTISIGAISPKFGYSRGGVMQIISPTPGGPFLRTHSSDYDGATTVSASSIAVVAGKTYWINLSYRGATNELITAAFDPDNNFAQVGNTVSCASFLTTGIVNLRYAVFGRTDGHGNNPRCGTQTIFDNIMIDYTNGAFPLLPDISTGTDTTPPGAPGIVRDGITSGIDISSTTSTSQLSANWTAAVDTGSAITAYQYAIGTTPGGTNTSSWATISSVLSTTKTGLSLNVGTTYYFTVRAISSGGTGLAANSNGVVVISTYVAPVIDTSSPTAPGAVRDGTGIDIPSTVSNTTLSANWDVSTDTESGILRYEYAISSTTANRTSLLGWTSCSLNTSVTRNSLALRAGVTYYFNVRAVNTISLIGPAANSNGQYVVAIDTSDVTPPSNIAVVRDGLSSDVDSSTSLTQLSANWDPSADAESGILRYWYAIGTAVSGSGASNITGWTSNGHLTSIDVTGLVLSVGTTYYVSVKAENGVGLQSSTTTSNGQYVAAPPVADTTPPVISNVAAGNITATGAVITWTTNEPSTSQVEYGKTTGYGKMSIEDPAYVTPHSVALIELQANNVYHFRVISRDASGNESTSADYTFDYQIHLPCCDDPLPENIHAYPNPYRVTNTSPMMFKASAGTTSGEVSIYTVSGRLIKTIPGTSTDIQWDGTNTYGEKVGRGIYVYKITSNTGDTVTGKIALK
ncbi:MAG: hypothetical protein A2297_03050 [Elusimicrobia bacterium RIFOXYB2_FULL_48_7]|nr:MAG: hypothetical protein A2297_03050 [Elusimicrobia bacterium RIFOXYB2_FULL_48_7]